MYVQAFGICAGLNVLCCLACCACGNAIKDNEVDQAGEDYGGDASLMQSPKLTLSRTQSEAQRAEYESGAGMNPGGQKLDMASADADYN